MKTLPFTTHPPSEFTFYTPENFPHFLTQSCRNWEIRHDGKGYCAAIAVAPGCKSSHMGTMAYVAELYNLSVTPEDRNRLAASKPNARPWELASK